MNKVIAIVLLGTACAQTTARADETSLDEAAPVYRNEQAPARHATSSTFLDGAYAGAAVGPVFFRDNEIDDIDLDYDVGGQLTAYFGKRISRLRLEAELASQGVEFDPSISRFDGDLNVFRVVANVYLDVATFDLDWVDGLTPYLGGGLGIAFADIEGFDDETGFTYHGEIGLSFPVHPRIDVVPAYRYERTDFSDFEDDQEAHTIRAGARYNF